MAGQVLGAHGQKYPDLERGESAGETGRDHIPPRVFKEAVHLNRMKEQILKLMTDTNLLNKKSKMEELEALLDKSCSGNRSSADEAQKV
ncbi:MAG: hypothetical protein ACLRWA_09190 [Lachnospira sp.]